MLAMPAQAAIESYTFTGEMTSGFYNTETFNGSFSFDDTTPDNTDGFVDYFNLTSASFTILGSTFTQTDFDIDAPAAAFDAFDPTVFLGILWDNTSVNPDIGFSFNLGTFDATDAFVAYDTGLGLSGDGDITFTAVAAVPEPETYTMFLAGLGLMGYLGRRRNNTK